MVDPPEVAELGAQGQRSDDRLFMHLQVFSGSYETSGLLQHVQSASLNAVLYESLHDPLGVGLLTLHRDPAKLMNRTRRLIQEGPFSDLKPDRDLTMFGRTYSIGYEPDLKETLIDRPTRTALNPDWPWAVWYPLRRGGKFEQLDRDTQMGILKEHGTIGMAFGQHDLAHDIRLASHGLDRHDNDFTIGLVGKDLAPLSKVVQAMRKTQQTSKYLESLGPFFVGRAVYQSALN